MIGVFLLGSLAVVVIRSRFRSHLGHRTIRSQAAMGLVPGLLATGVVLSSAVDLVPDPLEGSFVLLTALLVVIACTVVAGLWMRATRRRNHADEGQRAFRRPAHRL